MYKSIKRSKKAGLPPGTPVYIGDKTNGTPKITVFDYDEQNFREKEVKLAEECFPFKDEPTITWINVDGIHQTEIMEKLGDCFGFHHLVVEDILNTDQRPKVEDFGDYLYIVLKMFDYDDKSGAIKTEQISIILGINFVISFQETEGDIFNPIRERIRNGKGRMRKMKADYLAYALLDSIIDNYFKILEKLGERIEGLEEELIKNPTPKTLKKLHELKREMIFLRKSVWPSREVVSFLERGESSLIEDSTRIYLRDVYDHTIQIIDSVETFRDMLSGMLDIYLSSISNRMNEIMKVLTIFSTIFIPLTFIVGIYGMNFKYMPELEWPYGYYLVWGIMIAVVVTLLIYFRKKRWL